MKKLVLAEKPSVARDIARVLGANQKRNGYMEGDKYIVTWALGHLVTLAEPEDYNKRYKSWNMEDLPMLPSPMKLQVIKGTGKQFNSVKEALHRKDVGEIVIATDAGREGELVARWILEKSGVKKPIKRLWISSVTDKAIKDGFSRLKNGKDYENLYASAQARSEADWYVGINATRALTVKYNTPLSCGRVQTPTLQMIASREDEIRSFVPKDYYGIKVEADGIALTWRNPGNKDIRTFDREVRDKAMESMRGKKIKVAALDKSNKKQYAPTLYNLTELQRDANSRFGYSAKETLSIMQALYENHKILTYPRTDSRYLTNDIVDTLPDRIRAISTGSYKDIARPLLKTRIKADKSFVDDKKVSDHHAIIPTEQPLELSLLNDKEKKILDLVIRRFLSVLYPPYQYEEITLTGDIEGNQVFAKGRRVIDMGFKKVFKHDDEEDLQQLPDYKKGDIISVTRIYGTDGKTGPPSRFTEGTLLSAMENPVKYMSSNNKELKGIISETGGIGTVATRADIIEKLFNSFLMEHRGKEILLTGKGKQLLQLVPEDMKSPDLTARWESRLSEIAEGKLKKDKFIGDILNYAKKVTKEIKDSEETFRHDNLTRTKCPECGKFMLEVKTKRGKMYVCQDRECGHRKSISTVTNARCPQCKKKLELRGEGDDKIFACSCGYREKLSQFEERKKNEKNKLGKREVAQYMKKQDNKDDDINNSLADALKKLKL
ncbi:DNA topoisomerase III [Gudongella sp. DL1XJH-153]|uniref:DNA topoisomerase III n=1 Tax=Gudongella sp. DL1XJH-153 TaxID=3409804 RepID=UPI003BB6706D